MQQPSEETDGMVVDQPTSDFFDQEVLNAVCTDLSSQSDKFLKLDVQIDEFWSQTVSRLFTRSNIQIPMHQVKI